LRQACRDDAPCTRVSCMAVESVLESLPIAASRVYRHNTLYRAASRLAAAMAGRSVARQDLCRSHSEATPRSRVPDEKTEMGRAAQIRRMDRARWCLYIRPPLRGCNASHSRAKPLHQPKDDSAGRKVERGSKGWDAQSSASRPINRQQARSRIRLCGNTGMRPKAANPPRKM
jgi:hypothetical protein